VSASAAATPTPRSRDPLRHAPVFVLAPARSYSSVAGAMVGAHPDAYGFPELTMFEAATVGDRLAARPLIKADRDEWNPVAGLERALAQLHDGRQDETATAAARRWLGERRTWPGEHVLDHLFDLVAPLVAVEKSPGSAGSAEHVDRLVAAYPRARFLHLTRHPVTTAQSMQSAFMLVDYPVHCLRAWANVHERVRAACAALPPEQTLRVRAEDVLNDASATLGRVAAWLGLSTSDQAIASMLRPERSPFARAGPPGASGGNDPGFLRDAAPRAVDLPHDVVLPEAWNVPAEVARAVRRLALELDYAVS
jgi:Sulfotransferase family